MANQARNAAIALLIFAAIGCAFAMVSTFDFVAHLDRQVHSIHCSIIPGAEADVSGASGCHTVMMSPYSSLFRTSMWGGLPISLLALGVFAYLFFRALDITLRKVANDPVEGKYLIAATALPMLMTGIYGGISVSVLDAVCTNCVGIYVASLGAFLSAIFVYRTGVRNQAFENEDDDYIQGSPWSQYIFYFAEGLAFVALPVIAFMVLRPDFDSVINKCGELPQAEDRHGVMVPLHNNVAGTSAIELLDPLCPACRAFDNRLSTSGLYEQLDLQAVLFPLDSTCNWMVKSEVHPGACMVSEAVLCAGSDAKVVVDWAFENQEQLRMMAQDDPNKLKAEIVQAFPKVKRCIGKPGVRAKLNNSLRWAVRNKIPVLTPQLYVDGKKLCDEDTDLGLEYSLNKLLGQLDGVVMTDEMIQEAHNHE